MKTDKRGGASAESNLEARLADRFAAELGRAEHDYPSLGLVARAGGPSRAAAGRTRLWPRLIALPVGVAAVAIAVAAFSPLLLPSASPVPPVPASSGVVMGADGLPDQIDGQHVYRLADDWRKPTGDFLLAAHAVRYTPPCPPRVPALAPEDAGLIGTCMDPTFAAIGLKASAASDPYASPPLVPAPKGAQNLDPWLDGPAVVMRVHTHDPEAAGCSADQRTACETALVVEAVVWVGGPAATPPGPTPTQTQQALEASPYPDGVPAVVDGQPVRRASSLPDLGATTFLLGGRLVRDKTCAAPSPWSVFYAPGCGYWTVDGVKVGTGISIPESLDGRLVVARVGRSRAITDCLSSCPPSNFLYIVAIVWPPDAATGSAVPPPPAPPVFPTPTAQS